MFLNGRLVLCEKLTTNPSLSLAKYFEIENKANSTYVKVVVESGGSTYDSKKDPAFIRENKEYQKLFSDTLIPIKPTLHGRLIKSADIDWREWPVVEIAIFDGQLEILQRPTIETLM